MVADDRELRKRHGEQRPDRHKDEKRDRTDKFSQPHGHNLK